MAGRPRLETVYPQITSVSMGNSEESKILSVETSSVTVRDNLTDEKFLYEAKVDTPVTIESTTGVVNPLGPVTLSESTGISEDMARGADSGITRPQGTRRMFKMISCEARYTRDPEFGIVYSSLQEFMELTESNVKHIVTEYALNTFLLHLNRPWLREIERVDAKYQENLRWLLVSAAEAGPRIKEERERMYNEGRLKQDYAPTPSYLSDLGISSSCTILRASLPENYYEKAFSRVDAGRRPLDPESDLDSEESEERHVNFDTGNVPPETDNSDFDIDFEIEVLHWMADSKEYFEPGQVIDRFMNIISADYSAYDQIMPHFNIYDYMRATAQIEESFPPFILDRLNESVIVESGISASFDALPDLDSNSDQEYWHIYADSDSDSDQEYRHIYADSDNDSVDTTESFDDVRFFNDDDFEFEKFCEGKDRHCYNEYKLLREDFEQFKFEEDLESVHLGNKNPQYLKNHKNGIVGGGPRRTTKTWSRKLQEELSTKQYNQVWNSKKIDNKIWRKLKMMAEDEKCLVNQYYYQTPAYDAEREKLISQAKRGSTAEKYVELPHAQGVVTRRDYVAFNHELESKTHWEGIQRAKKKSKQKKHKVLKIYHKLNSKLNRQQLNDRAEREKNKKQNKKQHALNGNHVNVIKSVLNILNPLGDHPKFMQVMMPVIGGMYHLYRSRNVLDVWFAVNQFNQIVSVDNLELPEINVDYLANILAMWRGDPKPNPKKINRSIKDALKTNEKRNFVLNERNGKKWVTVESGTCDFLISDTMQTVRAFLTKIISAETMVFLRDLILGLASYRWFSKDVATGLFAFCGKPAKMSIAEFIEMLVDGLIMITRTGEMLASGLPVSTVLLSRSPVSTFNDEFTRLIYYRNKLFTGLPVDGMMCQRVFIDKCNTLILSGEKLAPLLNPLLGTTKLLKKNVIELKEAHYEAVQCLAGQRRPFPLGVMIGGDPAIGKSNILTFVCAILAEVKGREFNPASIFKKIATSQYYDGYNPFSHNVIHFSEPGALLGDIVAKNGDDTIIELISLIDSLAKPVDMAFELKGKVFACPEMVICDSNNPMLNLDRFVENPSAYWRRFLYIIPHVKPEFWRDGTHAIDSSKSIQHDSPRMDRWTFDVFFLDPLSSKKSTKRVVMSWQDESSDIYALADFLREHMRKHLEEQEKLNQLSVEMNNPAPYFGKSYLTVPNIEAKEENISILNSTLDTLMQNLGTVNQSIIDEAVRVPLPDIAFVESGITGHIDEKISYNAYDILSFAFSAFVSVFIWACAFFGLVYIKNTTPGFKFFNQGVLVFSLISFILWMYYSSLLMAVAGSLLFVHFLVSNAISWFSQYMIISYFEDMVHRAKSKFFYLFSFENTSDMHLVSATYLRNRVLWGAVLTAIGTALIIYRSYSSAPVEEKTVSLPEEEEKEVLVERDEVVAHWEKWNKAKVEKSTPFFRKTEVDDEINDIEERVGASNSYKRIPNSVNVETWNIQQNFMSDCVHTGEPTDLYSAISRNVRKIRIDDQHGTHTYILGIKEDLALVNNHAIKGLTSYLEFAPTGFNEKTCKVWTKVYLDKEKFVRVDQDLVLIRVRGLQFKDITRHISLDDFEEKLYRAVYKDKEITARFTREIQPFAQVDGQLEFVSGSTWVYEDNDHNPGDCGLPLVVRKNNTACVAAIHAGSTGDGSFAITVDKNLLMEGIDQLKSLTKFMPLSSDGVVTLENGYYRDLAFEELPSRKSPFRYLELHSLNYFGKFKGDVCVNNKSKVKETKISQDVETVFLEELNHIPNVFFSAPAMAPFFKNGEYISPYNIALDKMNVSKASIPEGVLERVIDEYVEHIWENLEMSDEQKLKVRPLTMQVAINGAKDDRFLRRINCATSSGFRYRGNKDSYLPVVEENVSEVIREPIPKLRKNLSFMLKKYLKNETCHTTYRANLKDEPRDIEKVRSGKTRVFCASPIDSLILSRMFLSPIYTLMVEKSYAFNCAVGSNMLTRVDKLVNFLRFFSPLIMEGDYSNYDQTMPFDIGLAATTVISRLCEKFGYNDDAMKIVNSLLSDTLFPYVDMNGDFFNVPGYQPSGKYATAEDNSLRGVIALMVFFYSNPMSEGLKFFDLIRPLVYGDDLLVAVKESVGHWFNNTTYRDFCKEAYNMVYTSAAKGDTLEDFLTIDTCSFLKRKFVYREDLQCWVAQLSLTSLIKSLSWIINSKHVSLEDQMLSTLISVLWELTLHLQEEQYGIVSRKLITLVSNTYFDGMALKVPTYKGIMKVLFPPQDIIPALLDQSSVVESGHLDKYPVLVSRTA